MTSTLENNNYFNLKEYFNTIEETSSTSRIIFTFPNGYDGIVTKYSASNGWSVSVAVNGVFVDDTTVTDGFVLCYSDKTVEKTLRKIKLLHRRVAA